MTKTPKIYLVEEHHELYFLWEELKLKHLKLLHFDAHCDMHGLLVNKKNCTAIVLPGVKNIDCGNFITFALRDELVDEVIWIHDEYGGRNNDTTHVKYTTDFTALPSLFIDLFLKSTKYKLKYKEINYNKLLSVKKNVQLDIDWDFFALKSKPPAVRKKTIQSFFEIKFDLIPEYTFISYSADYVSPSIEEFNEFVLRLKKMFNADVINYSHPFQEQIRQINLFKKYKNGFSWRFRKYLGYPIKRIMNRIGIY